MRKQAGFSIIELVVVMAILALIMGALVNLFGTSAVSMHVGTRQEVVYEEARLLMSQLKTTLRYADKDSISPQEPDISTNKFSYKGDMWDRHMDIPMGRNEDYRITVEWKDDTKKQIQVTRENITDGSKKITIFPQDIKNSVFEGKFPITAEAVTLNDGNRVILYKVALPLQYEFNGQMKDQTLETKVVPSNEENNESLEEKIYKSYYLIRSIAQKREAGLALTASEQAEYDSFGKYYNNENIDGYRINNNDSIRNYLVEKKFNGSWPAKSINGVDLYIQPYCDIGSKPSTDNIFVFGSTTMQNSSAANNWNANYIYDRESKVWYTGKNYIMIANKSLATVKSEMRNNGWTSIK